MAFTRSELRDILGESYNDDIAKQIITLHRGVVDPLRDDLDSEKAQAARYKADADALPDIRAELEDLRKGDYRAKYEKEHTAFEEYKAQVTRDAETAKVKTAFRSLLTDEKISDKAIDAILNATDYSNMKLLEDGTLDGVDALKKDIDTKWGGFRVTTRTRGATVETPPKTGGAAMTREEIMKIRDTSARQKAIAENMELFQKG